MRKGLLQFPTSTEYSKDKAYQGGSVDYTTTILSACAFRVPWRQLTCSPTLKSWHVDVRQCLHTGPIVLLVTPALLYLLVWQAGYDL